MAASNPRNDRDARGYGRAHKKTRAKFGRMLKKLGRVPCARCGYPVFSTWPLDPPAVHVPKCTSKSCEGQCWTLWDAGHNDERDGYNGLGHRCCNRSAGAVNSNRRVPPKAPRRTVTADYGW